MSSEQMSHQRQDCAARLVADDQKEHGLRDHLLGAERAVVRAAVISRQLGVQHELQDVGSLGGRVFPALLNHCGQLLAKLKAFGARGQEVDKEAEDLADTEGQQREGFSKHEQQWALPDEREEEVDFGKDGIRAVILLRVERRSEGALTDHVQSEPLVQVVHVEEISSGGVLRKTSHQHVRAVLDQRKHGAKLCFGKSWIDDRSQALPPVALRVEHVDHFCTVGLLGEHRQFARMEGAELFDQNLPHDCRIADHKTGSWAFKKAPHLAVLSRALLHPQNLRVLRTEAQQVPEEPIRFRSRNPQILEEGVLCFAVKIKQEQQEK